MNKTVDLFRTEPGFYKLFNLFKEKYRSLGRLGGYVKLSGFTRLELESVAGFLAISPEELAEKGKVGLIAFEKALKQTAFAQYSLPELIENVLGEKLITKAEEIRESETNEAAFWAQLVEECPEGRWWWEHIRSKAPDARWIWALYHEDAEALKAKLLTVFSAYQALPAAGAYERLPLFSQRVTGQPHFFDQDRTEGKLFLHCLYVGQFQQDAIETMPKTSEEINDLLAKYGLLKDDLWSFVTCCGLIAETASGAYRVFQAALEDGASLNVPMRELVKLRRISPAVGNKVWILENSSVCSTLMDEVPGVPIICTHGQFRTAAWILIDRLLESDVELHYSGDLDPEGLQMAARLHRRAAGRVRFWRMDVAAYQRSRSDEDISDRLSKLEGIHLPELAPVIDELKKTKKAGYQEGLISELIADLQKEYGA